MTPWEGAQYPPRRWQAAALPIVLDALRRRERGIVSAVMGSGKSVLQAELCYLAGRNLRGRRIVVSAPRKKLVQQLSATVAQRCGADRVGVFYSKKKQIDRDVIVACNASLPKLARELADAGLEVAFLVLDEAHSSESRRVKEAVGLMAPVCMVGFTATPFRSAPKESIELFDRILYRYTLVDAVADGVLVPLRHVRIEGALQGTLDEECLRMMRREGTGPGIVSATSKRDADEYAAWLTEQGWHAESIHSGHTDKQQVEKLEGLRLGRLRCLVHVSLLAEGVDLPWLRWLCLRRKVQASVRFLQEIGRPCRTDPKPDPVYGPKVGAVVMDPHLALGMHGLNVTEAVGRMLDDAANTEGHEGVAAVGELTPDEAVALDMLVAHLQAVHDGMRGAGLCEERREPDGAWRIAAVSDKQVEALSKASKLTRHVPRSHRKPLRTLLQVPWVLTRGACSDLLDVLFAGARWAREEMRRKEDETGSRPYPNQVQWQADIVGEIPVHEACLAVGRGGRRLAREESV